MSDEEVIARCMAADAVKRYLSELHANGKYATTIGARELEAIHDQLKLRCEARIREFSERNTEARRWRVGRDWQGRSIREWLAPGGHWTASREDARVFERQREAANALSRAISCDGAAYFLEEE